MSPTPITPAEVKELRDRGDRIVFVDARNPMAWGSSKVKLPGAIRVPVDEVDAHLREIPRDGTIVTYCT
jgi:rhodanese-related sulfurtransferase